jgi:hypothetical protein
MAKPTWEAISEHKPERPQKKKGKKKIKEQSRKKLAEKEDGSLPDDGTGFARR